MRKLVSRAAFALAVVALVGATSSVALAHPSYTSPCSGCHGGPALSVAASLVSNNGTTATYNASATGASAIAVFQGSTKLRTVSGSSGQFSVPAGHMYMIYAVKGPTTSSGIGSKSISPSAVVPDTMPPTTMSNVKASYPGTATVTLSPMDNMGGSGVAHTYYKLDGGLQTEGKTIVVGALGPHTLEFWSADNAGNVETPHKLTAFDVKTPTTIACPTTSAIIAYGAQRSITGTLSAESRMASTTVVLQSSPDGTTWKASMSSTTSPVGGFAFTVAPRVKTYYRVRYAGAISYAASVSKTVVFTPKASLSAPYVPTSVVHGRAFTSWGYLKPRHTAGTYPVKLYLYRYQYGKWVLRTTALAKAGNYSSYTKYARSISLQLAGRWRMRAYHGDAQHAATFSAYRYVLAK